jgi:hypothetical protein
MRTNDKFVNSAAISTSSNGPAEPTLSTTRDTTPINTSGGARLREPPAVTIGTPASIEPNRNELSIDLTVG